MVMVTVETLLKLAIEQLTAQRLKQEVQWCQGPANLLVASAVQSLGLLWLHYALRHHSCHHVNDRLFWRMKLQSQLPGHLQHQHSSAPPQ